MENESNLKELEDRISELEDKLREARQIIERLVSHIYESDNVYLGEF
jgi:uncharacterized coiled-coil protein SlyX